MSLNKGEKKITFNLEIQHSVIYDKFDPKLAL